MLFHVGPRQAVGMSTEWESCEQKAKQSLIYQNLWLVSHIADLYLHTFLGSTWGSNLVARQAHWWLRVLMALPFEDSKLSDGKKKSSGNSKFLVLLHEEKISCVDCCRGSEFFFNDPFYQHFLISHSDSRPSSTARCGWIISQAIGSEHRRRGQDPKRNWPSRVKSK